MRLFRVKWYSAVKQSTSAGFAACGGYDRWMRDPAIIVAGVAELEGTNRVMLIQSALVVSALSTFLQLFPIGSKKGFRLGAGLPVIMGTSFAYVASMQAIAADVGIAAIFGAQIIGGIIAMIMIFY